MKVEIIKKITITSSENAEDRFEISSCFDNGEERICLTAFNFNREVEDMSTEVIVSRDEALNLATEILKLWGPKEKSIVQVCLNQIRKDALNKQWRVIGKNGTDDMYEWTIQSTDGFGTMMKVMDDELRRWMHVAG